jgi:hypothetical protein
LIESQIAVQMSSGVVQFSRSSVNDY